MPAWRTDEKFSREDSFAWASVNWDTGALLKIDKKVQGRSAPV
jgi:hypothetical protein